MQTKNLMTCQKKRLKLNTHHQDILKKGEGLKIMIPSQLLTKLPILLAQKQAGNNSQKLSNEIRQIIYSLYRSIYNHLINSI